MSDRPNFDLLVQWAPLSDQQIEQLRSDENIAKLQGLVPWLIAGGESKSLVITRENFVENVREMYKLLREGSRALGQAIIDASRHLEDNRPAQAIQVYERFLTMCGSRFYRDIAEYYLRTLGGR